MQRRHIYRVMLSVGATVLALALAEVVCRRLAPPPTPMRFQQDVEELEAMRLHAATRIIEADPELFWRLVPDMRLPSREWPFFGVIANGQSCREAHDIPLAKPPGEIRILFLGDSCTFGYGVAHDAAFPEVVESILRRRSPDVSVECINAGVPGYTLYQGRRYLETRGVHFDPDLVVLNFGWNDYSHWDDRSDHEHELALRAATPPVLLRHSRLAQVVWSRRAARFPPARKSETRPRVLPDEFAALLRDMKTLTRERGVELLVLVWPARGNTEPGTPADLRTELQAEMNAFGDAHPMSIPAGATSALDLVPLARDLVAQHGVRAVYFDKGHVTPLAHQAIAQAIAAKIAAWFDAGATP